jgi:isoamylase
LGQQKLEFREMVQAFHKAGIEVILDVVFNHTAEGNELGPTLCFRGMDNAIFYTLADDKRYYKDYTGTGNTVNANHPVVRDHILAALRYWMVEMHIDGFRFDLASVLGRDRTGKLLANAPLLERIAEDPILRDVKIIAEAWDAAGAYEVGSFSQRRWAEWNGRYRDDIRRFWRGDDGMLGSLASRICGSADIYTNSGKGPESSINFVTCHDGFTLNDLVSYQQKHNEANGESNHDGLMRITAIVTAPRAKRKTSALSLSGSVRSKISCSPSLFHVGCQCCSEATNFDVRKEATTMPIVKIMKRAGMTGAVWIRTGKFSVSPVA